MRRPTTLHPPQARLDGRGRYRFEQSAAVISKLNAQGWRDMDPMGSLGLGVRNLQHIAVNMFSVRIAAVGSNWRVLGIGFEVVHKAVRTKFIYRLISKFVFESGGIDLDVPGLPISSLDSFTPELIHEVACRRSGELSINKGSHAGAGNLNFDARKIANLLHSPLATFAAAKDPCLAAGRSVLEIQPIAVSM